MKRLLVLGVSVFVGAACYAQVVINEIGWAGTVASAYDEWIELYNASAEPVDLTGWTLVVGEREIPLSGTIAAHGFYLLERTDDDTIPGIAADLIYKGALSNSGGVLKLVNSAGVVVDTANLGLPEGWWAGDAKSRAAMERVAPDIPDSPVAWRTAPEGKEADAAGNPIRGTPAAENAATALRVPITVSLPEAPLSGTVRLSWEVEGNEEGIAVRIFVRPAGGDWTPLAEGLPPVGAYELDTTSFPNGVILIAVGAFDEGGPRGGVVVEEEIAN